MTRFQLNADIFAALWLAAVSLRFRRSRLVLTGGLCALGGYALFALATGQISAASLGLSSDVSWLRTGALAVLWLALMLAFSPLADRIASHWIKAPPTLGAFRALQQSRARLLIGIVIAWALGGVLEELVFRGVILRSFWTLASTWLPQPASAGCAVAIAAGGAGVLHLYQGPRAALIITQLSILFGLLFVLSGANLWSVMFCHGLYDTIAFVRFANRQSKYSKLDGERPV